MNESRRLTPWIAAAAIVIPLALMVKQVDDAGSWPWATVPSTPTAPQTQIQPAPVVGNPPPPGFYAEAERNSAKFHTGKGSGFTSEQMVLAGEIWTQQQEDDHIRKIAGEEFRRQQSHPDPLATHRLYP